MLIMQLVLLSLIMNDEFYMSLAINAAWKEQFLTYPNPAVGCVLLNKYGKILSIQAHKSAGSFHAERLAINQAYEKYGKDELKDASIYVSLEPCSKFGKTPPCVDIILEAKIKNVFYACSDESQEGKKKLQANNVNVKEGILKEEAAKLIAPFKAWSNNKSFVLFKMALALNGSNQGKISDEDCVRYYHEMRSKLDLLVLCANTIRCDNPLLDARFSSSKKAPNLLIYSKKDCSIYKDYNFYKAKREVYFSNNIDNFYDDIKKLNAKNIMIEGGFNAFELFKDKIDWLFLQQGLSANTNDFTSLKTDIKLKRLFSSSTLNMNYGFYELA